MRIRLDPASPVPLYHQLAEALRHHVETGALAPGDVLPPLRQAAAVWGVNLHTVRHAYQRLASAGIVRTTAPHGTIVLASASAQPRAHAASLIAEPDEVVARFTRAREMRAPHEHTLGDVDHQHQPPSTATARAAQDVVHVIECSTSQALDLAAQVQQRWEVTAKPWSLERAGEPPAGLLVATYFHYNDIRSRWPRRLAQVQFASIHPDPSVVARIRAVAPPQGKTIVILCERDAEKARNATADLATVLPSPTFEIRALVSSNPATALHVAGRTQPVLFTPRMWGALGASERADERAIELRYLFDPAELEAVAVRCGWKARGGARAITSPS